MVELSGRQASCFKLIRFIFSKSVVYFFPIFAYSFLMMVFMNYIEVFAGKLLGGGGDDIKSISQKAYHKDDLVESL